MELIFALLVIFVLFFGLLFGTKLIMNYDPNNKILTERLKVENERLKLENEEKRALVEAMRKQQNIGGSDDMYGRVKE